MTDLIAKHMALALIGLAPLLALLYMVAPLDDKPHPDEDDPRCWCEAFGIARDACYCVGFEEES